MNGLILAGPMLTLVYKIHPLNTSGFNKEQSRVENALKVISRRIGNQNQKVINMYWFTGNRTKWGTELWWNSYCIVPGISGLFQAFVRWFRLSFGLL